MPNIKMPTISPAKPAKRIMMADTGSLFVDISDGIMTPLLKVNKVSMPMMTIKYLND